MATHNDLARAYLTLGYHYIRQPAQKDPFPRVKGSTWSDFGAHLRMIQKYFNIISLDDVLRFHRNEIELSLTKPNILLTFDDGLEEHCRVAQILAECKIQAVFFIPTCLLTDRVPINTTILHYSLARYGLTIFLDAFHKALIAHGLKNEDYPLYFAKGIDNPPDKIVEIKKTFKYGLSYENSQGIIMHIYQALLLKDYPNAFELMHIDEDKAKKIVDFGHNIGAHTHSHISVGSTDLSDDAFQKEIIHSKNILESKLGVKVESISYPFGEKRDYDSIEEKIRKMGTYQAGFTAEPSLNTKETSPLKIGRYLPLKADTSDILFDKLKSLQMGKEILWKYWELARTSKS
ncbi:hypothetical protein BK004_01410 [bacterium CG10_46_32]|nr:MAG: hypothetical protein BK004_01410 [bacterium CG10_46_32]PIR56355.1 MAG: hypothetical protein COU73_01425 [Parcubacteria group bacterium CG10_big_fil_rev_8_21_14_0_10_46_32]